MGKRIDNPGAIRMSEKEYGMIEAFDKLIDTCDDQKELRSLLQTLINYDLYDSYLYMRPWHKESIDDLMKIKMCENCHEELDIFNWKAGMSFGEGKDMCDHCYQEYS